MTMRMIEVLRMIELRKISGIPKTCLSVVLMCLSLSSSLNANPFSVYFADVIKEGNKEILHFEWRPDYRSYDKALIADNKGDVLAEVSYPKNSYDITKFTGQSTLFVTAVGINGDFSQNVSLIVGD